MRVTGLAVQGMYDRYVFELPLNSEERVTILHGANGLGKTTLLNMVQNVLRGAWGGVSRAPVRGFELQFEAGRVLRLHNDAPEDLTVAETRTHSGLTVELIDDNGSVLGEWRPSHLPEAGARTWQAITEANPHLTQTGPEEWLDRRTGHSMSTNALLARHPEAVPILRRLVEEPAWLSETIDAVPCRFIGADRLIVWQPETRFEDVNYSGWMPAVTWYSNLIVRTVRRAQQDFAGVARSLDRSFPSRVLAAEGSPPAEAELRERFGQQGAQLDRLHAAALVEAPARITLPSRTLDETERRVLWTYLEDSEAKLAVFANVLERLEILQSRMNQSFIHKRLVLDQDSGLSVLMDNSRSVPLSSLSSGEQHLLVLACTLLFDVEPGSLVLIDEPELSLHIAWQQGIVDSLIQAGQVRDLDFLIATHSPQVVHTHWDLAVDLEDLDDGYDPDEETDADEDAL